MKFLKRIFANKLILAILIFVQIGLLYGLTYWGYHSSRLPYWFDNFVQGKGIWWIYGKKIYGEEFFNKNLLVNPDLAFVKKSLALFKAEGYVVSIEENADNLKLELEKFEGEPSSEEVYPDKVKTICIDDECGKINLEDIKQGDWIEIYRFVNLKSGDEEEIVYIIQLLKE